MKDRRIVASGELLAIDPRTLIKGPDAMFWMFQPPPPETKRVGDTAIVYVRGPLEHHREDGGCNYEDILCEVREAREGEEPAKRVVLCIDSPGGVVSGLYETVDALRKLKIDAVYVEGLCASAAYALACSAKRIYCSRSSILGSVGVIATMYSQARRDKALGFDVITITSGKRKADGHPHMPISTAAVRAEEKRVAKFAEGFFDLVESARGVDPEPYEAGLFVGKDAVKADLADEVKTLDDNQRSAVRYLQHEKTLAPLAQPMAQSGTQEETSMRLSKLIEKTKAAIKATDDKKKKADLRLRLAAYTQTLADTTHYKKTEEETVEDDDEEEEEESESDDDGDEDVRVGQGRRRRRGQRH